MTRTTRPLALVSACLLPIVFAVFAAGCGGGGSHGGGGSFLVSSSNVDATRSTVTVSGATAPADGSTSIPVFVTIKDKNGNPIQNALVTAALSGTGTVSISGPTNAAGVATVTVTSNKGQTETVTITAFQSGTAAGTVITQTVSLTFTQIPVGGTSTIAASPTSVVADGATASNVTVTVVDATGTAVPNASVTFTATGTGITLNPTTPVATSATGTASVGVTSVTAQTGVTVTAAIAFPGSSSTTTAATLTSPPIAFVAGAATAISFASTNPATVTAGNPFTLTINVVDANGNTVTTAGNEILLNIPSTTCTPFYDHPLLGPQSAFTQGNTLGLAQNGVATFPGLILDTAGSYTVGAQSTTLGTTTTSFQCQGNVAVALAFKNGVLGTSSGDNTGHEPSTVVDNGLVVGGPTFNPSVIVSAVDTFGNQASSLPGNVGKIQVALNSGTTQLTDNLTVPFANVQALSGTATTFAFPSLGATGGTPKTQNTLVVSDTNGILGSGISNPFGVVLAAAAPNSGACQVVLSTSATTINPGQPAPVIVFVQVVDSRGTVGRTITSTTVWVFAVDQCGNVISVGNVAVTGGGAPAILSVSASTFSKAGTYTLFTSGSSSTGTGLFDGNNSANNPILNFSGSGASTTGTGAGTTITVTHAAPATYRFLMNPGNGYTFGSLTGLNTTQIGFGQPFTPAIQLEIDDIFGNICGDLTTTVTAGVPDQAITLALTPTPTSPGATAVLGGGTALAGTNGAVTANVKNGIVTFGPLSINNTPGNTPQNPNSDVGSYFLMANSATGQSGPLLNAVGSIGGLLTFNVLGTTGAPNAAGTGTTNAAKLVLLDQPANATAGDSILASGNNPNDFQVQVQDPYGNPVAVPGGLIVDLLGYQATNGTLQGANTIAGNTARGTTSTGKTQTGDTLVAKFLPQILVQSSSSDAHGIAHFNAASLVETQACVGMRLVAALDNSTNVSPPTLNWQQSNAFDVVAGPAVSLSQAQDIPTVTGDLQLTQGALIGPCLSATGFLPSGVTCTASGGVPVFRILDTNGNVVTTFSGSCTASLLQPLPVGAGTNVVGSFSPVTTSFTGGYVVFGNLRMSGQTLGTTVAGYSLVFNATNVQLGSLVVDSAQFDNNN